MDARIDLDETVRLLQDRIEYLYTSVAAEERVVIALAGIPGSGKSTLSGILIQRLFATGIEDVAIVPMDGFHLTKANLLKSAKPEEAFFRRGAPFTFDAEAFVSTAEVLRSEPVAKESTQCLDIKVPSFDHAVQDPVEDDITIPLSTKVVILEGNYTLLNEEPWSRISELAHEKWFVNTPRDVAKSRLALRHLSANIETSLHAAEARAEMNDLKNADLIMDNLIRPDVKIQYYTCELWWIWPSWTLLDRLLRCL